MHESSSITNFFSFHNEAITHLIPKWPAIAQIAITNGVNGSLRTLGHYCVQTMS